jgi:hypothetical protein
MVFYGWFVVAAAFAITFVGFGCTYSFSAFIESLQRDFGASRGSVSVVFALAARRRARGHGKKNPGGAWKLRVQSAVEKHIIFPLF